MLQPKRLLPAISLVLFAIAAPFPCSADDGILGMCARPPILCSIPSTGC